MKTIKEFVLKEMGRLNPRDLEIIRQTKRAVSGLIDEFTIVTMGRLMSGVDIDTIIMCVKKDLDALKARIEG